MSPHLLTELLDVLRGILDDPEPSEAERLYAVEAWADTVAAVLHQAEVDRAVIVAAADGLRPAPLGEQHPPIA
jgi:hypothetical protein